jgi:hypothetical protein
MNTACLGGSTVTSRLWTTGTTPEQRDWVKIQSAKSTEVGQDSTGVDICVKSERFVTSGQLAATTSAMYAKALPGLQTIVQPLLPSLNEARQNLLVQGIPRALIQGSTLTPEILGGLNLVGHSTELAYPEVDVFAALSQAVRLTEKFGAEVAQTSSLGTTT